MKEHVNLKNLYNHYSYEVKNCLNDLKTPGRRRKQIPNILTASRFFAPFFIVPLSFMGLYSPAIILTCISASTDFFDGLAARVLDAKSEFGRELDPVCDKMFAAGMLLSISAFNPLILINLGLEACIATTNFVSKMRGNNPKTHMLGKIKTWSLSMLVIANYLSMYIPLNNIINISLFGITAVLQVGSTIKYLISNIEESKLKRKSNNETNLEININNEKQKTKSKKKELINELKTCKNVLENSSKKQDNYSKSLHL